MISAHSNFHDKFRQMCGMWGKPLYRVSSDHQVARCRYYHLELCPRFSLRSSNLGSLNGRTRRRLGFGNTNVCEDESGRSTFGSSGSVSLRGEDSRVKNPYRITFEEKRRLIYERETGSSESKSESDRDYDYDYDNGRVVVGATFCETRERNLMSTIWCWMQSSKWWLESRWTNVMTISIAFGCKLFATPLASFLATSVFYVLARNFSCIVETRL